jgi:molybdopterin-guanine dinucleotide biosynthesis protein A
MPQLKCDLIVNAGGASRRMGADKALLAVPPNETPLLRHVIERLSVLVSGETFVIANDPALASKAELPPHVHLIADDYSGAGALGGLATGLARCSGWAIAVACDMPLVEPELFAAFMALVEGSDGNPDGDGDSPWDAVVPRCDGRPQPLHSLYHRRCLPAIEALLAREGRRFVHFYDDVRVCYMDEPALRQIDPELRSLVNVNTPQDWQIALEQLE